jgi:PPM family protein phosphatase
VRITAAAATDIGRVREGNEDAYLNDAPLFAVADGMGGHQGGEVASRLALETLEVLFKRGRGTLADHLREANRAVFERSGRDAAVAGMGTTLTAAVAEAGRLRLAHVGDSRAYLLRDGRLRMLTEDHTLVQRMVERGEITEQEANVHPHRSMLTRTIGTEPDVQIDEGVLDAQDGDRILLCSDGLTGMVGDEQIERILRDASEPRDAVRDLVRAANAAGGVDNITVIVLDLLLEDSERAAGDDAAGARTPAAVGERDATRTARRPGVTGRRARGPMVRRVALWSIAAVLIVVVGLFGLRFYLDQQWYVGVANSRVAIFRGIPSEIFGFRLHHLVVLTQLPASEVQQMAFYQRLGEGVTAENRPAADDIVRQIGADLRAKQAAEDAAERRAERAERREKKQRREQAQDAA